MDKGEREGKVRDKGGGMRRGREVMESWGRGNEVFEEESGWGFCGGEEEGRNGEMGD